MTIQLTHQQQEALDQSLGSIPRIIDPRTNKAYVLLSEVDYEPIREILEDDRKQRAIRAVALQNAIGRMDDAP